MANAEAPLAGHTFFGTISSAQEAHAIIDASKQGLLPRVTRRLTDDERIRLVRPGAVFVWEEEEAGIRRWTDHIKWSPSRVSGSFLTYTELTAKGDDALVKQSFSAVDPQGTKMHLIAYTTRKSSASGNVPAAEEDEMIRNMMLRRQQDARSLRRLASSQDSTAVESGLAPEDTTPLNPPSLQRMMSGPQLAGNVRSRSSGPEGVSRPRPSSAQESGFRPYPASHEWTTRPRSAYVAPAYSNSHLSPPPAYQHSAWSFAYSAPATTATSASLTVSSANTRPSTSSSAFPSERDWGAPQRWTHAYPVPTDMLNLPPSSLASGLPTVTAESPAAGSPQSHTSYSNTTDDGQADRYDRGPAAGRPGGEAPPSSSSSTSGGSSAYRISEDQRVLRLLDRGF